MFQFQRKTMKKSILFIIEISSIILQMLCFYTGNNYIYRIAKEKAWEYIRNIILAKLPSQKKLFMERKKSATAITSQKILLRIELFNKTTMTTSMLNEIGWWLIPSLLCAMQRLKQLYTAHCSVGVCGKVRRAGYVCMYTLVEISGEDLVAWRERLFKKLLSFIITVLAAACALFAEVCFKDCIACILAWVTFAY